MPYLPSRCRHWGKPRSGELDRPCGARQIAQPRAEDEILDGSHAVLAAGRRLPTRITRAVTAAGGARRRRAGWAGNHRADLAGRAGRRTGWRTGDHSGVGGRAAGAHCAGRRANDRRRAARSAGERAGRRTCGCGACLRARGRARRCGARRCAGRTGGWTNELRLSARCGGARNAGGHAEDGRARRAGRTPRRRRAGRRQARGSTRAWWWAQQRPRRRPERPRVLGGMRRAVPLALLRLAAVVAVMLGPLGSGLLDGSGE